MYRQVAAVLLLTFFCQASVPAQSPIEIPVASPPKASSKRTMYATKQDIVYNDAAPADCVLDVYYPLSEKDFATVVWFHGGGLTSGKRSIPGDLKENGIAVVAVDYRLNPKVKSPTYVEDAAAAVAWTFENIAEFGGSREKIFVSGHSAGGYLTSMIGLDKHYLDAHGIDANKIAGLIPFSGHTITHFTVREERGIEDTQVIVDEMAPIFHARADAPPTLLITGDRELEMLGRYEENAYHWRMMKIAGHKDVTLVELGRLRSRSDSYARPRIAFAIHQETQSLGL